MQVLESKIIEFKKPGEGLVSDSALASIESGLYVEPGLDGPQIRYGYKIADFNFMIPESMTSEVIQNPHIFSLPKSPEWIHGLINVRGNITPVMDMHKMLNVTRGKNSNQRVLLIDKGSNALAVLIDELPGSLTCSDKKSSIHSLPDSIIGFCEPGYKQTDGEWYEFNIQHYFKSLSSSNG